MATECIAQVTFKFVPRARCQRYTQPPWPSGEASGRVAKWQATELRRYSREVGRWPVVLETREGWLLGLPVIGRSPGGAKVCLTERLTEGTRGRVYFLPPHWRPRVADAIVWRIDLEGIVVQFTEARITPSQGSSHPPS